MGKVIVPNKPRGVQVDGKYLSDIWTDKVVSDVVQADYIEIKVPGRAGMAKKARAQFNLNPDGSYLLLYESYNARDVVVVRSITGLKRLFAYGDGHGMRFCGFYRITGDWSIDYDVPGHHGHTTEVRRLRGTKKNYESVDSERRRENAPSV